MSILDIDSHMDDKWMTEQSAELFIEENYKISKFNLQLTDNAMSTIKWRWSRGKLYADAPNACVYLKSSANSITNGTFSWGTVLRFYCNDNNNITNLTGCPRVVDTFDCINCPNVKSLKGSPHTAMSTFICVGLSKLKSLRYGPKRTNAYLCTKSGITNIKYLPSNVTDVNVARNDNLTDISDLPESVFELNISHCKNVKSLKSNNPNYRVLIADNSGLTSLAGLSKNVGIIQCSFCDELEDISEVVNIFDNISNLICVVNDADQMEFIKKYCKERGYNKLFIKDKQVTYFKSKMVL